MFSWPDGPMFQWGERQWWRFLFYTSGRTRHAGSFHPTHSLSRVTLSLSSICVRIEWWFIPNLSHPHTDACSVGSCGNLWRPQEGEWFPPPRRAQNSSSLCFLPWFLIRSGLCRSIPLACWDSMGASTWGGGHGNADQGWGVFSPSHLFPHRSKIYLICFKWRCWFGFFLCGVCFWRFGHLALTIRWFSQPSEAHAQRSVGGIVGWNPMWAILITFLCCSLMRQRRGIIWTCFWGRFVSSA